MKLFYATALAVLLALPVAAQPSCGPYLGMTQQLAVKYGETVIDEIRVDVAQGTVVWQLWASAVTGTWTITGYIDGHTRICAFSAGDDYHGISLEAFVNGTAT